MSRFAYLDKAGPAKAEKPGKGRAAPATKGERLETVHVSRPLYRAVRKTLEREGREDVGELAEELLEGWLASRPHQDRPKEDKGRKDRNKKDKKKKGKGGE